MSSVGIPKRYGAKSVMKNNSLLEPNNQSQSKIRIKIKKMSAAAEACVNRLLGTNQEPEDEGKYMKKKDIKPLKNPEKQIKIIFKDILSSDWQKQFEACNTIRALVVHHKELFMKDAYLMQNFLQGMVKQVENLRSTVSKNALISFKDIIEILKKRMDNELDFLIPAAMKKATDTNVFLSKAATEVLISASKY